MEVTIDHLGSVQFEIKARQHTLICDQPPENGGFDEGMTPPELLLASLGSCAGFYAAQVTAEKMKEPARLGAFVIEVDLPVEISEEHKLGVERAVHHCLIHNTLLNPPKIELDIRSTVGTTAHMP
jgi:putative redox protein